MGGIIGVLATRGSQLCVQYEMPYSDRPVLRRLWWAVVQSTGNPYTADRPEAGDVATSRHDNTWHTARPADRRSSGSVYAGGEAVYHEEVPVPCPKVRRGVEVRWHLGAWEKLSKRGWVRA